VRIALNQQQKGLQRAQSQVNLAAHRISKWGLSETQSPDTLSIDGLERPRNVLDQGWGGQSKLDPNIDLGEEAIRLKSAEWAFRANIAATRTVLDMERIAADLGSDDPNGPKA
jgi:hypothetical protein